MRTLIAFALLASIVAMPAMAAPQGHGHGGGGGHVADTPSSMPMNHDAHGDAVSAEAKSAKAADEKVGPAVSDVAQDKANGKGLTKTKSKGKGH
jgi:hypothetical protein